MIMKLTLLITLAALFLGESVAAFAINHQCGYLALKDAYSKGFDGNLKDILRPSFYLPVLFVGLHR